MHAKTHGSVRGEKRVTEEKYVSIYGEYSHSVGTSVFMCLCASAHEGDAQAHMYAAMCKPEISYSGRSPIRTWESSVALDELSSEPQGSCSVCFLSTESTSARHLPSFLYGQGWESNLRLRLQGQIFLTRATPLTLPRQSRCLCVSPLR